mgnify:CR=1 FL=1
MPNWCENVVNIYGDNEDLQKFRKECMSKNEKGSEYLDFAKVIPEPDYETTPVPKTFPQIHADFAKTEEEKQVALKNEPTIREDAWWDWRLQNWGTKSNLSHMEDFTDDDGNTEMIFYTAWAPPHGIYDALVEKYPDLTISWFYHEPGVEMAGYLGED